MVRENMQLEGFDFNKTFAPILKMTSVPIFLLVAVAKKWELHQMDVNNVFLHGDLEEDVYMHLPPNFTYSSPMKVCKLRKSLYGLRQAPSQWFAKLSSTLFAHRFARSYVDYSLFAYQNSNIFLALLVYVDDITLARNDSKACAQFKTYLNNHFPIKVLSPLKYFLGIKVPKGP